MSDTICQIVDSSGNLPRSFIEQYRIREVPFYFKFNNPDFYRENVDYKIDEFYRHMEEYPDEVPTTSCPNIYDWLTVFEEQYAKGIKKFIVTTISSKLSSSFQTAVSAKEIFKETNQDIQMEVINSNTCACGQAALEIGIAKMIDSGGEFGDIVETIYKMITNASTLFVVNSLKYMKSGGRIGGAAAFLGRLIDIRPICEFVNGVVRPIKAVRGRKHSLKAMIDTAVSRMIDVNKLIIIIQNARCQEDAGYIIRYLRERTNFAGHIYDGDLGIIVGAHSGPGAIGIGFVEHPQM
ncbi:DegV family protein [Papillibacter cinnamivorans]|uniref:EDD domain protein, DegV family n=1 Tax=Papillibacter cinnamivorans DSM 12816 TaxID=1122930 RepID=A0A1W1YM64_9FIRM|nr:DegV family protein [Papillibacter cinnamivorans]SMC37213.1 EDD domain protein, DegV family [Papillibacter cinnamivorans DSM 12816]